MSHNIRLDFTLDIVSLLQPLTTPVGWGEILILMLLELALGIDNIVFISITSNRLPEGQQHLGRRLGLLGAMVTRCLLLCSIVWIMSFDFVIVTLPFGAGERDTMITVRDLVFILGGAYLIYKGIGELRGEFVSPSLDHDKESSTGKVPRERQLTLPRAVLTIMVMDVVFSLDSVITAAGLSGQLLVMIVAVIGAISIMMIFVDPISDFINNHYEVRLLALAFIAVVGLELILKGFHIEQIAGSDTSTLLYGMMVFGFIVALLSMAYRKVHDRAARSSGEHDS